MNFGISASTMRSLKAEWDTLRLDGHNVDYRRAVYLRKVRDKYLHHNMESLRGFIGAALEEGGKRASAHVRMVVALDVDDHEDHWSKLGGRSMILMTRVDGRRRSRIWTRVNAARKRGNSETLSENTFRNILREILGENAYRDLLTERKQSHPHYNYRAQCVTYQQELFRLINNGQLNKRHLSLKVRMLLGMVSSDKTAA